MSSSFQMQNATGVYHITDSDGKRFYPIGINHLQSLFADTSSGDERLHRARTLYRHMDEWYFNCAGYGSSDFIRAQMPHFGEIDTLLQGFYRLSNVIFPDVFSTGFSDAIDALYADASGRYQDRTKLIGLFWADCPSWDIFRSRALRCTDWVSAFRRLPPDAPGKKAYIGFLLSEYADRRNKLAEYYGLPEQHRSNPDAFDFSTVYVGHPEIIEDDLKFIVVIAEKYYAVVSDTHRRYFPETLCFGDRFLLGDHPDRIAAVAARYTDAIAVQIGDGLGANKESSYPFPEDALRHLHVMTGKPVFIADHQISFYTDTYNRTIFSQAGDEAAAAAATEEFLAAAYAAPYICGYLRCTYITKTAEHDRGMKQGLVDQEQKKYPLITRAYANINGRHLLQNGPEAVTV